MKLQAQIAIDREDKIRWLVIESDENDTKGYFIYYHISDNNAYDTWHKSLDEAFQAAQTQYGILKEDWIAIQ
jgi:hypothetical protein